MEHPILIFQGGKDFEYQLEGQKLSGSTITYIKSRFVYFLKKITVLQPQNAQVWQKSSLNG
jgi:hypothetical protein